MMLDTDAGMLRIVLDNLIQNAIKYSQSAKPEIRIGKLADQDVYFVQDNGIGFDMEFAGKLFTPFQRLHHGSISGSGIGLATVQRVISRLGGRIWAESEPGRGTSFYFSLKPRQ
jgi:signal transduction histidine kinase